MEFKNGIRGLIVVLDIRGGFKNNSLYSIM
jgi:hypothetical protein